MGVPGRAARLPERREDDLRVLRIEGEVYGAGVVVLAQDFLPGLPAVSRAEDSALGIGAVAVSESGDEDEVGVLRIHEDLPDLAGVRKADGRPRPAAVGGLVHAVAVGDVGPHVGLAGADGGPSGSTARHIAPIEAIGWPLAIESRSAGFSLSRLPADGAK
jgi:hypothetical protein